MRVRHRVYVALCAWVVLLGVAAPSGSMLEVHVGLEPDHIILGQPVWLAVSMTNRSADAIVAEGVSNCFNTPLQIDIPAAQRRIADASACAHRAESCQQELVDIAPGQTVTRRYALKGNFITTTAGNYGVGVRDTVRYGKKPSVGSPALDQSQVASMSAMLIVSSPNPRELLALETSMAQRAVAVAPAASPPPNADIETLRRFFDAQRTAEIDAMRERYALAEGLGR